MSNDSGTLEASQALRAAEAAFESGDIWEAVSIAQRLVDRPDLAAEESRAAQFALGVYLHACFRSEEAESLFESLAATATPSDDLRVTNELCQLYWEKGDLLRMIEVGEAALQRARRERRHTRPDAVELAVLMASIYTWHGDQASADRLAQEFRSLPLGLYVRNDALIQTLAKAPEDMRRLTSREFEQVIAHLLEMHGYKVQLTGQGPDGGVDIYARLHDPVAGDHLLFLVECKRYVPPNQVSVPVVRALSGLVAARSATGGIIATTSYFTRPARLFADSQPHRMTLRDFTKIKGWLERTSQTASVAVPGVIPATGLHALSGEGGDSS